ncbi:MULTISPECIES: DUF493 family protein [unclassified Carboxylicivirga]|uniref:DUF493 family protein n=1 Tax=Carboxylicivirga TaxID=1628153 RepID=UPI003D3565AC
MSIEKKYEKLKALLTENKKWPLLYMFKFIAPNQDGKVQDVVDLLPKHGTVTYKHTKNLKYVSVTCKASMKSADAIIEVTSKISEIKGVISL